MLGEADMATDSQGPGEIRGTGQTSDHPVVGGTRTMEGMGKLDGVHAQPPDCLGGCAGVSEMSSHRIRLNQCSPTTSQDPFGYDFADSRTTERDATSTTIKVIESGLFWVQAVLGIVLIIVATTAVILVNWVLQTK